MSRQKAALLFIALLLLLLVAHILAVERQAREVGGCPPAASEAPAAASEGLLACMEPA